MRGKVYRFFTKRYLTLFPNTRRDCRCDNIVHLQKQFCAYVLFYSAIVGAQLPSWELSSHGLVPELQ